MRLEKLWFAAVTHSRVALICLTGCLWLTGCPIRPHPPEPARGAPVEVPPLGPGSQQAPRHEGRPYDVDSSNSLLTVLAFRGGALAKAGHNHVIAAHNVRGTFYVPDDLMSTTFELHIAVADLTIDEPELRAKEGPDFGAEVPESAKEGTRHNMLSEALLNGAQYPDITLVSQRIESVASGAEARAAVQVGIHGEVRTISVPVTYSLANGELTASGDLTIKQTDLGLTPFSAVLGALQVQDELRVRFHFVARQAGTRGASS
jgi:polyisoprenoid-binding protein YceI